MMVYRPHVTICDETTDFSRPPFQMIITNPMELDEPPNTMKYKGMDVPLPPHPFIRMGKVYAYGQDAVDVITAGFSGGKVDEFVNSSRKYAQIRPFLVLVAEGYDAHSSPFSVVLCI